MLVNPGWDAVIPCPHGIKSVYMALDSGNLDLPISLSSCGSRFSSLRALVDTPLNLQQPLLVKNWLRVFNAQQLQRTTGDAGHNATLASIGMAHNLAMHTNAQQYTAMQMVLLHSCP